MKKLFALALSVLMLLGLLCGCNNENTNGTTVPTSAPTGQSPNIGGMDIVTRPTAGSVSDPTTAPTTDPGNSCEPPLDPTPAGTLVVTMGSAFEIVYNSQGKVVQLTGTNDAGKSIADANQEYIGSTCVIAVRGLLSYAAECNLIGDAKTMALRVKQGDSLPSADFLGNIATDVQYLADEQVTGIQAVEIGTAQLDAAGLINADTAKQLAALFLGCAAADLTGETTPANGLYTFTGNQKFCTVDAATGLVTAKA